VGDDTARASVRRRGSGRRDLARGAGLDETLDEDEVRRLLAGMSQLPDEMRGDFFGPKIELGDDADDQSRMLAYSGRKP
jgi:hypothetical protein